MVSLLTHSKRYFFKGSDEVMNKSQGLVESVQLDKFWLARSFVFDFLNIEEAKDLFVKLGWQSASKKAVNNFLWGMLGENSLTEERLVSLVEECINVSPINVLFDKVNKEYVVVLRLKESDLFANECDDKFYSSISARWLLSGYLAGYLSVILLRDVNFRLLKVKEFDDSIIYLQLIIKTDATKSNTVDIHSANNDGLPLYTTGDKDIQYFNRDWDWDYITNYI